MRLRLIACLVVCSMQGCGPADECPRHTTGGISQGDTVQTTILGTTPDYISQFPSCAGLGDLPIGATVTSTATVGFWAGDICDYSVHIAPTAVSMGTLSQANGYFTLQLPNGCTGGVGYEFDNLGTDPNASLLATDGGSPSWVFVRTFEPEADGGGCPQGTTFCKDAFVCENIVLH